MSAVLYASVIYAVPGLIGWFSPSGELWATKFLLKGRWFPVVYGFVIFVCGLIQFGDSSPVSMGKYLNAVRCLLLIYACNRKMWCRKNVFADSTNGSLREVLLMP